LSQVTSNSYVGVASVQQADGTELAKQVIIFPKELRGAAEGSVLTDGPGATTHSRMTNGSVSKPAISHSRMTNGSVEKGGGSTLVVRYQDGSQTISIPAGVQVVLVAKEAVTLSAGDTIYAATEKLPDGMLTTNKILQIVAASPATRSRAPGNEPSQTPRKEAISTSTLPETYGRARGQEASSPGALESLAKWPDPSRPHFKRHLYLLEFAGLSAQARSEYGELRRAGGHRNLDMRPGALAASLQ
jgi:hypothetical protein